jgi:hypothetical protein
MSSIDDYSYDYLDYQESELMKLWHKTLDSIWGNSESSESADYDRFL